MTHYTLHTHRTRVDTNHDILDSHSTHGTLERQLADQEYRQVPEYDIREAHGAEVLRLELEEEAGEARLLEAEALALLAAQAAHAARARVSLLSRLL